jgi:hypothetical protein
MPGAPDFLMDPNWFPPETYSTNGATFGPDPSFSCMEGPPMTNPFNINSANTSNITTTTTTDPVTGEVTTTIANSGSFSTDAPRQPSNDPDAPPPQTTVTWSTTETTTKTPLDNGEIMSITSSSSTASEGETIAQNLENNAALYTAGLQAWWDIGGVYNIGSGGDESSTSRPPTSPSGGSSHLWH